MLDLALAKSIPVCCPAPHFHRVHAESKTAMGGVREGLRVVQRAISVHTAGERLREARQHPVTEQHSASQGRGGEQAKGQG